MGLRVVVCILPNKNGHSLIGLAAQTNPQREQGPSVPKVVLLEQFYNMYMVMLEWLFIRAALARAAD